MIGFIPPSQHNKWMMNPGVSPPGCRERDGEAANTRCLFTQTGGTEAAGSGNSAANRRFTVSRRLVLVLVLVCRSVVNREEH